MRYGAVAIAALLGVSVHPAVQAQQITSVSTSKPSLALAVNASTGAVYSLNNDLSVSFIDGTSNTVTTTCPTPAGLKAGTSTLSNLTQNAIAADSGNQALYVLAQDVATSPNGGVAGESTSTPTCVPTNVADLANGADNQALLAVDTARHLVYAVSSSGDSSSNQTLVVIDTSKAPVLTTAKTVALGSASTQYTGILLDPATGKVILYGGSLAIYDPSTATLTSVYSSNFYSVASAFFVPNTAATPANLLALVPGTQGLGTKALALLVDLSKISGSGFTLETANPIILNATSSYTDIVGGAYSARTKLLYVDVATSTSKTELRSYNYATPTSPNETVVADTSGAGYSAVGTTLSVNDANGSLFIATADQTYAYNNPGLNGLRLSSVPLTTANPVMTRIDATLLQDPGVEVTSFASSPTNGKAYVGTTDSKVFILTPASTPTTSPITLTLTGPAAAQVSVPASYTVALTRPTGSTATATPTGTVTVTAVQNGTTTTLGTVSAAAAFANGGATVTATLATAGTYSVIASYPGDTAYQGTTSGTVTTTVSALPGPTTLRLTAPATATLGTAFSANVSLTAATANPTGNVIVTATAPGVTPVTATTTAAAATASGGVAVPLTLVSAGTYTISASYAGESSNGASTSAPVTMTVAAPAPGATTLRLSAPATATVGSAYSATVTLTPATSNPTGNVTVTATAPGVATLTATTTAAAAAASGGAAVPIAFVVPGTYTISASYAGDAANAASTATTVSTVVSASTPANASFTLDFVDSWLKGDFPSVVDITQGPPYRRTVKVTVSSVNGYASPVALTLSRLPNFLSATITDTNGNVISSVTPGSSPVTVNINLQYDPSVSQILPPTGFFGRPTVEVCGGLLGLLLIGVGARRKRKSLSVLAVLLLLGAASTGLTGCIDHDVQVTVTAAPAAGSPPAPAQSVMFHVYY